MKILHTIEYPWWNGSAYYGITIALATAMMDHDVRIAGREGCPPIEKARELGLHVIPGVDLRGRRQWRAAGGLSALKRVIRDFQPEMIVSHDADSHTLSCIATRFRSKRPLMLRSRGDIREPSRHPLSRYLYGSSTDAFLLSGDFMIRRGDFKGIVKRDRLHVIHPVIDVNHDMIGSQRGKLRKELGVPDDCPLTGLVARYDPVKGHETFLKVAWRLDRLFPEARYVTAGVEENLEIEKLRRMSREMGLADKFSFLGKRTSPYEIIDSLDIGVIASRGSEAVCRIVLEYMAAGVPVVASAVGVIPEVIEDGETGFLVPPDDYEAMARKVGALMKDRELRERMGREARSRVKDQFSMERMMIRLEGLISHLTGNGEDHGWPIS